MCGPLSIKGGHGEIADSLEYSVQLVSFWENITAPNGWVLPGNILNETFAWNA